MTDRIDPKELAAMRAQAYPNILNDKGVEWKLARMIELETQLAQQAEIIREARDVVDAVAPAVHTEARLFPGGTWEAMSKMITELLSKMKDVEEKP